MVNWDYLRNNITTLELNTTNLTNPYEVTSNIVNSADSSSGGYLGLSITILIFLIIMFITFRSDEDIRMDLTRSIMFSSGFSTIIGVIMLVSNISSSFTHVMWFFSIFMISIISLLLMKKKNL